MTSDQSSGDAVPPGEPASPGEPAPPDEPVPPDEPAAPRRRRRPLWRELPVLLVLALVIALLVKSFVVQPFFIPSSSMEDTLEVHDRFLVNKLAFHFRHIQAGDIVVFNGAGSWTPEPRAGKPSPDPLVRAYHATIPPLLRSLRGLFGAVPGETDFVKRVIGVPGDRVACCNTQGLLTVNGVTLHETSYLHPGERPFDSPVEADGHFAITVPPGRLWVMGDNRLFSEDSRLRREDPGGGTIPESEVIGRAALIVWPLSRWRVLPLPATFAQPGVRPSQVAPAHAAASRPSPAAVPAVAVAAPSPPYLPLGAGLAGAVPLTWLQRRLRGQLRRRLRGNRHGGRS
jgi:signal peptidase I